MKKYIFLLLLFATSFINGQSSNMFFWYDDTTNSSWEGVLKGDLYYTNLNGTTQYWSKTTPTGLDLNGAEMIPKDSNTTFESLDTTDWTGYGTATADTSSTRKYAGSYSLRDVTTGVGDSTTNYISLAATNFTAIESGKKYTAEYWVNAVGSLGSNLIPDSASTFSTYPGGGITYWTVNRGTTSWNTVDSSLVWVWSGVTSSPRGINKPDMLVSAATYELTFRARSDSNRAYNFSHLGNTNNANSLSITNPNLTSSWQNYRHYFIANGTTAYIGIGAPSSMTPDDSVLIDNIILKRVTKPTYTLVIGDKSFTSDTISIIPGVFEKVVFNFLATASTVGQAIKIYCSQADTGWIDNFSITQAKDLMVNVWVNVASLSSQVGMIAGYGTGGKNGWDFTLQPALIRAGIRGNVNVVSSDNSATINMGTWYLYTFLIDRIGTITTCQNGVSKGTSSLLYVDKVILAISNNPLQIGARNAELKLNGKIGETQITTFDDISTLDKTPAQIYARGRNRVHFYDSYTGGTIVGWWFNTATANDASGNGNNLTGTGSPTVSTLTTSY